MAAMRVLEMFRAVLCREVCERIIQCMRILCFVLKMLLSLGGGFKDVLFSSLLWGFMIQFDYIIFFKWVGWNHQLVLFYISIRDCLEISWQERRAEAIFQVCPWSWIGRMLAWPLDLLRRVRQAVLSTSQIFWLCVNIVFLHLTYVLFLRIAIFEWYLYTLTNI